MSIILLTLYGICRLLDSIFGSKEPASALFVRAKNCENESRSKKHQDYIGRVWHVSN
jgi:hypothetical protein